MGVTVGAATASALIMAYGACTKKPLRCSRCHCHSRAGERGEPGTPVTDRPGHLPVWLESRPDNAAGGNAFKASRLVAERDEMANAFLAAELPDGFHRAVAEIYGELESFKDCNFVSDAEVVARALKSRPS